ncbi:MAG: aminotransferase class I/II-fold pyridoxal phosphate-dependent enzyme [Chloroflexia bacterium]|nr:aminotransferase class I/II-fold pyridoxal phosphate-dependent enzyme [Chloroflexia bacterium]
MNVEPFALERWMTTYEMNVQFDIAESGILPMSMGELLGLMPQAERDEALARLLAMPLNYSEACGTLALRSALAATYPATTPDQILVTTGAIEANYLLFHTLLKPGDHVVAVHPAYQQLHSVPQAIGCNVSLWELRDEGGFHYDLDDLRQLVTPQTKLIIVNTPHNPTGAMLSEEQLREIYALAEANDAYLLCDEAYRWLDIPGGDPFAPPARSLGAHGISVGTLSKPFGLPGLRIGWIAATDDVISACWSMRDYISLSPGKLSDALAVIAIENRDAIIARNQPIIEQNLVTALDWFAAQADVATWSPPRGGLLALMKFDLPIDSLALANRLAEEYSVMLAPGSAFGYESHLRLGLGQDPEIFAEGLRRTATCFAAVANEKALVMSH